MLLTAVSCNPVFISVRVMLSHEATVLLLAGLLDTAIKLRTAVYVQAYVCACVYTYACEFLHTSCSNCCFSLF